MTTARRRRRDEAGFSLIEVLVAISLVAVSLLALIGAFEQSQKAAGIAVGQARAELVMRQATDTLRSRVATPYVACATPAGYAGVLPAGASITPPISFVPAGTGPGGPLVSHACGPDAGVQRITVSVSIAGYSLTRVVFKGER